MQLIYVSGCLLVPSTAVYFPPQPLSTFVGNGCLFCPVVVCQNPSPASSNRKGMTPTYTMPFSSVNTFVLPSTMTILRFVGVARKPTTFVLQKRSNTATEFALGIKTRNGYGYQERPVCEGIAEHEMDKFLIKYLFPTL